MGPRPHHIDLAQSSYTTYGNGAPSPNDMPSPRSGEAAPSLSPLDAFAQQSRLLSQRLEAGNSNGSRMSRLPPVTIADALAKHRAAFQSNGNGSAYASQGLGLRRSPTNASNALPITNPDASKSDARPMSQYPTIQAFDDTESIMTLDSIPTIQPVQEEDEEQENMRASEQPRSSDYTIEVPDTDQWQGLGVRKSLTLESIKSTSSSGLAPPRSPRTSRSPGPLGPHRSQISFQTHHKLSRSLRIDSGDDSDSLSVHGERKTSFGSQYSRPRSPFSPVFAPPRSPSMSSEYSHPFRGSVNFSRPLSRNDGLIAERRPSYDGSVRSNAESHHLRPSMDTISVHGSFMDSPQLPPVPWMDNSTPSSMTDDDSSRPGTPSGATSYIYSKYSLPRGRAVGRKSRDGLGDATFKFEWEQPNFGESNVLPLRKASVESVPANLSLSTSTRDDSRVYSDLPKPVFPPAMPRTHSADGDSSFFDRALRSHKSSPSFPPANLPTLSTTSSSRTIVPIKSRKLQPAPTNYRTSPALHTLRSQSSASTQVTPDPAALSDALKYLTPEGHLAIGIDSHENGELQKSTYHLRLAAKGGNPTAMLLYALACRHGWGMRADQAEGIVWLRKAVDMAGLEVADDETLLPHEAAGAGEGHANAVIARRAHKARLALAIYELGVSYMNGWGISQDKPLALRCFEIAGGWGDGDALAEAGFCYAKGVGAKKDLKKAADLYRKAAEKGVEMAGNSWIYKEKYLLPLPPPEASADDGRESRKGRGTDKDVIAIGSKKREKSRTRAFFAGRKKQQDT